MLAEIAAGFESLKAATDLLKVLNTAATQTQINEVKLELQEKLLDAQRALFAADQAQAEALKRIGELEQEIVRLKNWEAEKQRYQLKEIEAGAFAYVLKPGMENGEPTHWLCANCYEDGRKRILQRIRRAGIHTSSLRLPTEYECPGCDHKIAFAG